jgi:hypothetical protein
MQPNPDSQSAKATPETGNVPPLPSAFPSQASEAVPPATAASPPPLSPKPTPQSSPLRQSLAVMLSVCLGLFLADALVSLVDDSLILFFDVHLLTGLRGLVFLFATLMAILVYGLMGLTPMVPKRLFLPLTLFGLVAPLALVPCLIYFFSRIQQVAWSISACQVLLGLGVLYRAQRGSKLRWPWVPGDQLPARHFSWLNLSVFLLANVFVLLPAGGLYLVLCARLACDHFSDGFLALRPDGLTVQVRKYVRSDGKTVHLVPMSHIGETEFYRKLSQSFPTNSVILMEGVTDERRLLTNRISYKRMATSLGLAEQQKEFKPSARRLVHADVDIAEFATNTIDFLNLVMLIHARGMEPDVVLKLMEYSAPPEFQERLIEDLLRMRNRRLLEELEDQVSQAEHIIVPWGAAHMPGIAAGVQKAGFRLNETRDYVAIRFRSAGKQSKNADKGGDSERLR